MVRWTQTSRDYSVLGVNKIVELNDGILRYAYRIPVSTEGNLHLLRMQLLDD